MKLYVLPGACSLASHIALHWAGSDAEMVVLSRSDLQGDYTRINPKASVPALLLDDGTVLTESLAVLLYIADTHPAAQLGATDVLARARLNEALAELVSDVNTAWAPFFSPARFVASEAHYDEAKQAAAKQIDKQYRRLDGIMQGRDWRVLGRRTVADAYLYIMCTWKDKSPQKLAEYPALAAFRARLDQDTGVQKALAMEAVYQ